MLAEQKPGLVSVCAFPGDREEMVLAALEAGAKLVWAEKPFALTAESARRMMAAAEKKGARIFVGFQRRYGAPFFEAVDTISVGRIGRPRSAHIVHPGPCFIDFGPHLLDAALSLIGGTKPVAAYAAIRWSAGKRFQGLAKVDEQMIATAHFQNGVRLTVESGERFASASSILRADGDRGFLELVLSPEPGEKSGVLRGVSMDCGAITCTTNAENFHHGATDTNLYFDRLLLDIARAHETGASTRVDAIHALTGVELFENWERSARENRVVTW